MPFHGAFDGTMRTVSKRSVNARLDRLEQLKGLLKDRDHVTASELAKELGVSLRTLNRDLAVLRAAGAPIESDRGRGGGLRLDRGWSLGRLHLRQEEAVDLLLAMAIAEKLNSPLLLRQLPALRRKIVASFGEAYQARIRLLRRRIFVGAPASPGILANYEPPAPQELMPIVEAFFNLRRVEIAYSDRYGVPTVRKVEPQFLYYAAPIWYLLAHDRLRNDIRSFRVDRIRGITVLEQSFRPAAPEPYLAAVELGTSGI
jgi:predicted DNA-binding transcriptional regulator YafY